VNYDLDSILEEVEQLKKRVEFLEREYILNSNRIDELERTNVANLNMMFQLSNDLEEKIENLKNPVNYNENQNYTVEHL
jgi:archaellum component FlaC